MKNSVFLGAALTSFCALAFYISNTNHMQQASLKIYGNGQAPYSKQKEFSNKSKTSTPITPQVTTLTTGKKSNQALAKVITTQLNNPDYEVQVSTYDLRTNDIFAKVQNTSKPINVSSTMKLFVLLAYEKAIAEHHLTGATTYTVKPGDLKGNDPLLKANMGYSFTYLCQLMMSKNNNNAANILLTKLGKDNVNKAAAAFGAKHTQIKENFNSEIVGETTADDLAIVMRNLYQGKVLNSGNDNQILGKMINFPDKGVATKLTGTIYRISDKHSSVVLVQNGIKTYTLACTSQKDGFNFADLGSQINNWYAKN